MAADELGQPMGHSGERNCLRMTQTQLQAKSRDATQNLLLPRPSNSTPGDDA